jgi:hypothetical protein
VPRSDLGDLVLCVPILDSARCVADWNTSNLLVHCLVVDHSSLGEDGWLSLCAARRKTHCFDHDCIRTRNALSATCHPLSRKIVHLAVG